MPITKQNTLPDPDYAISDAGGNTAGSYGPGFKDVKLASESKIMKNRTNSGRLITRSYGFHKWTIDINYNPMTREEFEPVYNFLLNKRGGLDPFFVSLPQYRVPRDPDFATYVASNQVSTDEDQSAGSTHIKIDGTSMTGPSSGDPRPGDLFTFTDPLDSNHTKAYMVTEVETEDVFEVTGDIVNGNERIIHFTPALAKDVSINSAVNFHNPKIRVIMKRDTQQYALGVDGLYKFSLSLEEAQP